MLYGHFYGWDLVCPKEFGTELMGTYAQFDHFNQLFGCLLTDLTSA